MQYTVFDTQTGGIKLQVSCPSEEIIEYINEYPNTDYVEGFYDVNTQRIDTQTKQVLQKTPVPYTVDANKTITGLVATTHFSVVGPLEGDPDEFDVSDGSLVYSVLVPGDYAFTMTHRDYLPVTITLTYTAVDYTQTY